MSSAQPPCRPLPSSSLCEVELVAQASWGQACCPFRELAGHHIVKLLTYLPVWNGVESASTLIFSICRDF